VTQGKGRWLRMCIALCPLSADAALSQTPLPAGASIDTVATGLNVPWGLAFAPDGRLFVSERIGRIRVIDHGQLRAEPWATIRVAPTGAGLLGLALAPDFARSRELFVMGSFGVMAGNGDTTFENRLLRLTDSAGVGVQPTVVLANLPSNHAHAGSQVRFGPDGMLYVTLGDAFKPESAQDVRSMRGKILRMRRDGSVPPDNPFPGSLVFAYGLRNAQGLAWDSATHTLFATEHGPSNWPWEGGRRDHDELNVIVPGGNYGWPVVMGIARDPRFRDPIAAWTPAIAPSGLAFYAGPFRSWSSSLLLGALRGQQLRRIAVARSNAAPGWRVVREESFFETDSLGRIRGVFVSPKGEVYFTTSDRKDSRTGEPDDRIYRLRLPVSP
jgi:glucose/arabinose dehydrogenase